MRKLIGLLIVAIFAISCQDDDRKELVTEPEAEKVPDSIPLLEGDFVYVADAAVLRGDGFVYGVSLDSMSNILAEKVAPLKSDDFEMIPVKVRAKIVPNPQQEGWDEVIEIREIIEVPEAKTSDTIENKKKIK